MRVARGVQRVEGRERGLPSFCVSCDGWSFHAWVVVEAAARGGLLRLGRDRHRPTQAVDRLEVEPDGRVRFTMRRTPEDGTAALSPIYAARGYDRRYSLACQAAGAG
jgi:hypothetical protein